MRHASGRDRVELDAAMLNAIAQASPACAGVVDNPKVDATFALRVEPHLPVGQV